MKTILKLIVLFGLQQSKQWEKGTLCITIAANIAETGLLGFDACFPDSIIGFVANPKFAITEYVYYYLNSIKIILQIRVMVVHRIILIYLHFHH